MESLTWQSKDLTQSLLELWASDYAYPVQAFLGKGALVLEPNYRGSDGFGAKFRALNVRNLGVGDMWDVMSGVDALIARGIVDPARVGAMGWSEGGYVSAFLTTHTDRFRAISVGAGFSDWGTAYAGTDAPFFPAQYLRATPWNDPAIYVKTSPITTIKQARTPTLIQHGSNDPRVPLSSAFELYRGLQDQHVDSRLIIYQGFGHMIDKPKSALALLQANLDWFGHYLWNEEFPKDSPLYGNSEHWGECPSEVVDLSPSGSRRSWSTLGRGNRLRYLRQREEPVADPSHLAAPPTPLRSLAVPCVPSL